MLMRVPIQRLLMKCEALEDNCMPLFWFSLESNSRATATPRQRVAEVQRRQGTSDGHPVCSAGLRQGLRSLRGRAAIATLLVLILSSFLNMRQFKSYYRC